MGDIINIQQYGDALRSTGYKNIESAVSEIIDNSIEAEASNVLVLVTDKVPSYSGKRYVTEIAFLDDGTGMNDEDLEGCLQLGTGTRRGRKGIGRFGVGLPQASMHVCPYVQVYSWQNGIENCKMTFLDINAVKNGLQNKLRIDDSVDMPEKYAQYIRLTHPLLNKDFDFSQKGTLVIWTDCDNVSPKTVKPLFDRLEFALGQKFRHLINDDSKNIYLLNTENAQYDRVVMPNDPLFLMKPNLVLGNVDMPEKIKERNNVDFTEPLFEPFSNELYPDGVVTFSIKYTDRDTQEVKDSIVTLRFSVVRKEFYDLTAIAGNPGGTKMGQHVKKLEGISVVRSGREIDFGTFDFYSNLNEPEHRWWGCEISFTPELDEAFGVSNNKQHVELIAIEPEDYEDDDVKPVWLQLRKIIKDTIGEMYRRNKNIRKSARTAETELGQAERIINIAEEGSNMQSQSGAVRENTPIDEIREHVKEFIKEQTGEEPNEEVVDIYLNNRVSFVYKSNGRNHFFDYEFGMGISKCIINTDHVFYKNFVRHLEEDDSKFKTAFELFIASLVITIDEASDVERESFDELVTIWNEKLRKYINAQVAGGQ